MGADVVFRDDAAFFQTAESIRCGIDVLAVDPVEMLTDYCVSDVASRIVFCWRCRDDGVSGTSGEPMTAQFSEFFISGDTVFQSEREVEGIHVAIVLSLFLRIVLGEKRLWSHFFDIASDDIELHGVDQLGKDGLGVRGEVARRCFRHIDGDGRR